MDVFQLSYGVLWVLVIIEAIAILVLARAVGGIFLGTSEAITRDGLDVGVVAPAFEARDLADNKVTLPDHAPVWQVLLFAAPTCLICRDLLPTLADFEAAFDRQVRLTILVRGTVADARAMAEVAPGLRIVSIGKEGVAEMHNVRVSPYLQVVEPSGRIGARGLVNRKATIEHLLLEAGLDHPGLAAHQRSHSAV